MNNWLCQHIFWIISLLFWVVGAYVRIALNKGMYANLFLIVGGILILIHEIKRQSREED